MSKPKLFRFTDKVNGDERGITYSVRVPSNENYDVEEIGEDKKQFYLDLLRQQEKAKQEALEADRKKTRKTTFVKLEALGFVKKEIEILLNSTDNE